MHQQSQFFFVKKSAQSTIGGMPTPGYAPGSNHWNTDKWSECHWSVSVYIWYHFIVNVIIYYYWHINRADDTGIVLAVSVTVSLCVYVYVCVCLFAQKLLSRNW